MPNYITIVHSINAHNNYLFSLFYACSDNNPLFISSEDHCNRSLCLNIIKFIDTLPPDRILKLVWIELEILWTFTCFYCTVPLGREAWSKQYRFILRIVFSSKWNRIFPEIFEISIGALKHSYKCGFRMTNCKHKITIHAKSHLGERICVQRFTP